MEAIGNCGRARILSLTQFNNKSKCHTYGNQSEHRSGKKGIEKRSAGRGEGREQMGTAEEKRAEDRESKPKYS